MGYEVKPYRDIKRRFNQTLIITKTFSAAGKLVKREEAIYGKGNAFSLDRSIDGKHNAAERNRKPGFFEKILTVEQDCAADGRDAGTHMSVKCGVGAILVDITTLGICKVGAATCAAARHARNGLQHLSR
jgi:hypothetical protein